MTADVVLAGRIEAIIKARGATASAAREIEALLKSETRLVTLKEFGFEQGISYRTVRRLVKKGKVSTVDTVTGKRIVSSSVLPVKATSD